MKKKWRQKGVNKENTMSVAFTMQIKLNLCLFAYFTLDESSDKFVT